MTLTTFTKKLYHHYTNQKNKTFGVIIHFSDTLSSFKDSKHTANWLKYNKRARAIKIKSFKTNKEYFFQEKFYESYKITKDMLTVTYKKSIFKIPLTSKQSN